MIMKKKLPGPVATARTVENVESVREASQLHKPWRTWKE
jgi:hypothetical protein